jgi:hypothetical protein
MSMFKWFAAGAVIILAGVVLFFSLRTKSEVGSGGDPEARIISYLKKNVKPGQPVLVTELYNNVFTTPEERDALQRLYNISFKVPAFVAETYTNTGTIPKLAELSNQFQLTIPGEMDVLLRSIESDPRVPKFFERDQTTGEITRIYVDRIASDERFGRPLRNR